MSGVLSVQELAAWVETARSRAESRLFTATPCEDLAGISSWQRLSDLAFAGQCRAIVAAYNRARVEDREFVADEVALAIGVSPLTGSALTHTALYAAALPGLLEAVEQGLLGERHVRAVLRELDKVTLTGEQRIAVVMVLLPRLGEQTPGELAALVRRLILTVDLDAAQHRQDQATVERAVRCYPGVDGQGELHARGPLALIAAVQASLEATLTDTVEPGDDRSRDGRLFDLFIDLLTGGSAGPGRWHAQVLVPVTTAEGGELELAEIPGYGPVLPSTARALLDHADDLRRITIDAATGEVLAVDDTQPLRASRQRTGTDLAVGERVEPRHDALGRALGRLCSEPFTTPDLTSTAYRPSGRLIRLLEARDQTCTFPGCHRRVTDKDHRIPWPRGSTSAENLSCLCRHHHRAKHTSFTVAQAADGVLTWTTRGGHTYQRLPHAY